MALAPRPWLSSHSASAVRRINTVQETQSQVTAVESVHFDIFTDGAGRQGVGEKGALVCR